MTEPNSQQPRPSHENHSAMTDTVDTGKDLERERVAKLLFANSFPYRTDVDRLFRKFTTDRDDEVPGKFKAGIERAFKNAEVALAALTPPKPTQGVDAEIAQLRAALNITAIYDVENLGSFEQSGRPPRYFQCRLCDDWNDQPKHIEHAEGCPLYVGHPRLEADAVRAEKITPQSDLPGEHDLTSPAPPSGKAG